MNVWPLVPAAPFLAAVLGLLLGGRFPAWRAPIAVGGTTVAAVLAVIGVAQAPWDEPETTVLGTVPTGLIDIDLALRADGLAAVVAIMVVTVALAVQVYSIGYMAGDPRYSSYAALISLFTAAMLTVVLADDLFVLLVGWEVMGICSYFLIGHHWELPEARPAAIKAFLVTRVGDVGFLFGIFAVGFEAGSFRVDAVNALVGSTTVTVATLLLAMGIIGKSAQFPLHVWLPDAMAGPTPVSALIHAATMVAAGAYLLARLHPVFLEAPATLATLGVIASITMLGSALAALAQDDVKRVLAWSTISQLAYMVGALAVGGYLAGVFHMLTHAAFKALLFLCAGALIHAVGSNLMSEMGGLRRPLPTTFATMTVGLAALVGLPVFAGFFSKESVFDAAENAAAGHAEVDSWVGVVVLVAAFATVAVTGAYATRLWLRSFFGPRAGLAHPHEVTGTMKWPLVVLAVPAGLLGFLGLSESWLPTWLGSPEDADALVPNLATAALALLLASAGAATTYLVWRRDPATDPAGALGRLRVPFEHGFGIDAFYDRTVVQPIRRMAGGVVTVDDRLVDAAVEGAGNRATRLGALLRRLQTGNVQGYLSGLLAGALIIAVAVVVGS